MEELVKEIREEFHIPPYYPDEAIKRQATEGLNWLLGLNPGKQIDEDTTLRMLVKNYAYYAFYNKVNEFMDNYSSAILGWQVESEV